MADKLTDVIVTHNSDINRQYPESTYRLFLQIYHAQSGLGVLPSVDKVDGTVTAFINQGRWVVGCDICHTAVVPDDTDPYFCCPACGSGGFWREVLFPVSEMKAKIETVLLMRPGFRHNAPARNWEPSKETLDDLRWQNIEAGDPVP